MQKQKDRLNFLPCLMCGVDSGPVLSFFFWLIGGVLLASVLVLLWAISTEKFDDKKNLKMKPIEVEGATDE
jgi:hypothetical protein